MRAPILLIATALALAGCASQSGTAPLGPSAGGTFARQIAGPATYLGQMPTAVVLLKPGNTARNLAFCQQFTQIPSAEAALSAAVIAPNIIPTRWPVTATTATTAQATDCANFLVPSYDYARAQAIIAAIQPTTGNFAGAGPFLLIIDGTKAIAVDGSSTTDFAAFVNQWQSALNQTQNTLTTPASTNGGVAKLIWIILKAVITSVFPASGSVIGIIEGVIQDAVCP
jgi:hypothetical protein